jgi:hypothetical protein
MYMLSNDTKSTIFNAAESDENLVGLHSSTVSEIFYNGSDPNLKQVRIVCSNCM